MAESASVVEEPQTRQPVCDAAEQRAARSIVVFECPAEVPSEPRDYIRG